MLSPIDNKSYDVLHNGLVYETGTHSGLVNVQVIVPLPSNIIKSVIINLIFRFFISVKRERKYLISIMDGISFILLKLSRSINSKILLKIRESTNGSTI